MPGSYQAVYNGAKAFLDSFSYALREKLKETNVTVTWLMPRNRILPARRYDGYQGRHG
jgi:short-subunit dehydrogenase